MDRLGHANGRKYVKIESDARHVQLIFKNLGLTSTSASKAVPGVKVSDAKLKRRLSEPQLPKSETSAYRSRVMRATFLSQDRADIGETVKVLARNIAKPTAGAWRDLQHLGRYLIGKPNVVLGFDQQVSPKVLITVVDSDHGADRLTRKSTTGTVQRLGIHTIKTTTNLQTPIGLNVSEAEYYALVHLEGSWNRHGRCYPKRQQCSKSLCKQTGARQAATCPNKIPLDPEPGSYGCH